MHPRGTKAHCSKGEQAAAGAHVEEPLSAERILSQRLVERLFRFDQGRFWDMRRVSLPIAAERKALVHFDDPNFPYSFMLSNFHRKSESA
jgi:hypothetical protein